MLKSLLVSLLLFISDNVSGDEDAMAISHFKKNDERKIKEAKQK